MEIRKLTESDYDQIIELYKELDDFHAQARPDYFVYREKDEIYPKDAFIHNLAYPGGLELGAFDGEQIVGVTNATLWEESGMIISDATFSKRAVWVTSKAASLPMARNWDLEHLLLR